MDPKNRYKMSIDKEKLLAVQKENNITLYVGDLEYIFECLDSL